MKTNLTPFIVISALLLFTANNGAPIRTNFDYSTKTESERQVSCDVIIGPFVIRGVDGTYWCPKAILILFIGLLSFAFFVGALYNMKNWLKEKCTDFALAVAPWMLPRDQWLTPDDFFNQEFRASHRLEIV